MANNNFTIDFFELSFLAEACIPPRPIARGHFWGKLIDLYYDQMTQDQRDNLFEWINRCYGMEEGIKNKNESCLLFNARYDKNNQYEVTVKLDARMETRTMFLWQGRYHSSENQFANSDYIIEVKKVNNVEV
ncbi:MAG TPA: hypothetical protein VIV55_09910 [Flavobacterium sp.]